MGHTIEFTRPDGKHAPGYLTEPQAGSGAPGVVLLEEWWGLTDYIKTTADQLSSAGLRVLVPDLFRGRTAAVGDEANHLLEGLDFNDAADQDARGALQYLKSTGSKRVAVMGFCMGGALAMLTAMRAPEVDALVDFYGATQPEAGDPGTIKVPFQGHWAIRDAFFPIARVDDIEARLQAVNTPHEFYRYDAEHAFHNPNDLGHAGLGHYDEGLAKTAWQRTVDFLSTHLK